MIGLQRGSLGADRLYRVAIVTSALSGTGAIVGAFCGAVAITAFTVIEFGAGSVFSRGTPQLIGMAVVYGALAGSVAAPLLAWGVLRRVPLGRAIVVTALGTVIGSVVGELYRPLNPYVRTVPGVIVGAFAGFLLSGIALRLGTRAMRHPPSPDSS